MGGWKYDWVAQLDADVYDVLIEEMQKVGRRDDGDQSDV